MDSTSPVVLKKKIWKFPEEATLSDELLAAAQGSEIIARLMLRRGIDTAEKAMAFLDPANYEPSSPMTFADMSKAVARINKAILSQERVTVYGDYDVDGVTGTSVLYMTLKLLGANVDYYIPNRASEGYGLNLKAVSILASKHRSKLIITCDCGVSNFAEINLAKSLGVETIIVDHHSMPEVLPPAVAILHPKQLAENHPLFHLPGVGVAYKLAEALLLDKKMPEEVPKLLDFVTLGMIADMVPLVQENRYLVQIGLPLLVNSPRAGIRALMDNTVKMEGTDIVGFGLAPRINAVGRLADASLAVKLMTVDDDATAQELAHQLEVENSRRQELCEQIFFEADMKAKQALANGNDRALALYSANWHHGVVGIVASRLVEKYHCPVFVAELDEVEGKIKGSARSANGVDLYQILKANEALMTKWGGHQMAAGFSAEASNAELLCRGLVDTCNRALLGQTLRPSLEIDLELDAEDVHLGLAKLLRKLGPFGMWNKKPVLALQNLEVLESRPLGKEGKHHRLMLRSFDGAHQYECVYWRSAGNVPANGLKIDLAFIPEVNVFNKSERLQLVLSDWRRHGEIEPEEEPELIDFSVPENQNEDEIVNLDSSAKQNLGTAERLSSSQGRQNNADESVPADLVVRLETRYDGTTASSLVTGVSAETSLSASSSQDKNEATVYDMSPPANGESKDKALKTVALPPFKQEPAFPLFSASAAANSSMPAVGPALAGQAKTSTQLSWKDLRSQLDPASVVDAAVRRLGDQVSIFAEACKLKGHELCDRSSLESSAHLLIWQYPPSLQVFKSLINKSQARNVYICGAGEAEEYDASSFLKRLLAMVRFAVNQRDGEAHAEKLCAALATSKMAIALGLTLLKKVDVIDWYAEDSMIFLELLGSPNDGWETLPEFRQLNNTLREITDFRNWCAEAPLDEIQSELVPNATRLGGEKTEASQESAFQNDTTPRANYNDRTSYLPSDQPRKI